MRWFTGAALFFCLSQFGLSQGWNGYGGDSRHSGVFNGASQAAAQVHWSTPLDDRSQFYGGTVLTHYASVMVTPADTVVNAYRYTTVINGVPSFDHWRVIARTGGGGSTLWQYNSDYSAALIYPNSWTSVYPATLCRVGAASASVFAGAAGSIFVKSSADQAAGSIVRVPFYTTLQDFDQNEAAYAPIKICTPITGDNFGNVFFGYQVTSAIPSSLSALGTGGVVRVNLSTGTSTFKSVQSLGIDPNLSGPSTNAAPAVTADGSSVYVALTGGDTVLAELNTQSLAPVAHTVLYDPSVPGAQVTFPNVSSASPMIGPDGHVFMGVFGAQYRESHGWMLQFDGGLSPNSPQGTPYPVGGFGWDDTPSVVPAAIVPSYHGAASYLILTKYNNYDFGGDAGADGHNKIALLDPSSNSLTRDRQSGIPVMNEILTVLGPNRTNDDPSKPDARFEWCINSAAVDVPKKSAIINSEDGHMYRWSFVSNSIIESLDLQPPTGEAYTSTAIGPDGQIYAVNNAILFAIGSPFLPVRVSVYQGSPGRGTAQNVATKDGLVYSTSSVSTPSGQSAAIEADFTLPVHSSGGIGVTSYAAAVPGSTGFLYAYNYASRSFVLLGSGALGTLQTSLSGRGSASGSEFIGPNGAVRVVLRALLPAHISNRSFTLSADMINCSL